MRASLKLSNIPLWILRVALASASIALVRAEDKPATPPDLAAMAQDPVKFLDVARKTLKWDEPAEPAHIIGPIYFVGTRGLSSFLITTSAGHILLDTGMPDSGPLIAASIRKLGFKPEDIRILLVNHAHVDHIGGHAHLQELSGARMVAMRQEKDLIESGGKIDFHYGHYPEFGFDPVRVDQAIGDGDTVQLGNVAIKALLTNGHTKGSTTYVMSIDEKGTKHTVVFPDGTSVNPGYRLTGKPSYPGIKEDFERTLHTLESLKPDIWLLPHTDGYKLFDRLERAGTEGIKAWVDPEGYKVWVASRRDAYDTALANEIKTQSLLPERQP